MPASDCDASADANDMSPACAAFVATGYVARARSYKPTGGGAFPMAFFFEDGFLPRGAGLLARAAGFLGAGDLLRAATRFVAVCFGVPSPEARPGNDGALVSAVASPRVDDGGLRDDYFGHRFGAALEMRRETECTFTPKKLLA